MNAPQEAALAVPTDLKPGTPFGSGIVVSYRFEGTRPYLLIAAPRSSDLEEVTHQDAIETVKALTINDVAGWTLPNRGEALDLYEILRPAVEDNANEPFVRDYYWTAAPYAGDPASAWCQSFTTGRQYGSHASTHCRARAVRRLFI